MAIWNVDTAHSNVGFTAKHMMFTTVRGKFEDFAATIEFDPANPGDASVNATIQVASVNTGVGDRDNHLRSADFFDAANYPELTFTSTRVEPTSDTEATVYGDLTIRGTTREVALDVTFLGEGTNPWGQQVGGFTASTKINREDFGLTWNQALETGGVLVSKEIKIELELQAAKVTEGTPA
ncbi:MAG: polyisoprenoid-binding protein [Anaerolineae bacterium]|nr:polyisoprenoid-binding protein [Anaerolineae bacterium]MCA9891856.1 polyisoprenoid-binding protein [Anaerolineae bacterium]MCB9461214.1 polyisoprenoid-binding protein [Anaerolineaceae bacterium]